MGKQTSDYDPREFASATDDCYRDEGKVMVSWRSGAVPGMGRGWALYTVEPWHPISGEYTLTPVSGFGCFPQKREAQAAADKLNADWRPHA